jgi:acetylornithine aminotransferase
MNLFNVYPLYNIEPVRGDGAYVYDENDTRYLDLYGGHAVISIGHNHPHFLESITKQLNKLAFYSNSIQNPLQQKLADLLGKLSGCNDYELFLCNSGAEANENALKMASFQNGRTKIIAFQKAFHGRTSAAVNITDNQKIKAPINTTYEVEFHAFNDIENIARSLSNNDICAVIIEGIQGVGGIHVPSPSFLEEVERLCRQHGTLLILDEIQSGYGRSGNFFAFQYANIEPDLITMAKGMGNGFPIGGVLIHPKFKASYGLLGTTFGGSHLACAAGIAVLEVIESENLIPHAGHLGCHLMAQLLDIPTIVQVRGSGLMIGLQMNQPINDLRNHLLFENHIFTGSSSDPKVIRLLPPLSIQQAQVDFFVEQLKAQLSKTMVSEGI